MLAPARSRLQPDHPHELLCLQNMDIGSSDYDHRGSVEFWPPLALGYGELNWAVWLVIWPERGTG